MARCFPVMLVVSVLQLCLRLIVLLVFLIVSMITIDGINMVGVPWGIKCSNMWLIFLIHPNSINLIHRGWAKVSVLALD